MITGITLPSVYKEMKIGGLFKNDSNIKEMVNT